MRLKCIYPLIFSVFILLLQSCAKETKPLNVVIFIADDISWDDFGCYGNKAVKTPTIDSLANKGLLFTNAFLTTSSCSPSRASIITGRYPHNTGAPELHMPLPSHVPTIGRFLKQKGYFVGASGKWHLGEAAKKDFHQVLDTDIGLGGEDRWIEIIDAIPENQPYFLWMASIDAHRGWGENTFSGSTNREQIKVPPYMINDSITKTDFEAYYDEITRFDHHIKTSLQHLKKLGKLDNTLIIIMADNGRPFPRDKTRMYDSGIKTPLVINWNDQITQTGKQTDALVSAIDIASTIAELTQLEETDSFQGKSFAKTLANPNLEHRDYVFAEHNWHDYAAFERMVRTKNYLLVENSLANKPISSAADVHSGDAFQQLVLSFRNDGLDIIQSLQFDSIQPTRLLFDITNDKHQLKNLVGDYKHQKQLDSLTRILRNWQEKTGDYLPKKLTLDRYDFYTGKDLRPEKHFLDIERGEIPGSKTKASKTEQ